MPSAAPTRARRAWNVQDFEAVEAYGVERWLGELALALSQETYRPDPIRSEGRSASKIGSSTSIANSMPTVPGETRSRRWSRSRSWCFAAIGKWWTPTFADYFGSIPHAEPLKSVARRIASDQDVAGLPRGRNRRSGAEDKSPSSMERNQ